MIDLYLKFEDEAEANAILFDGDTSRFLNTDVIGVIYKPTGETVETDDGPVPALEALPGWHVNIRPMPGEDFEPVLAFAVHPTQPVRVWS